MVVTHRHDADTRERENEHESGGFFQGAGGASAAALLGAGVNAASGAAVTWVDPVKASYRGWDVWELPPNGQGIAALQILNLLEHFDIFSLDPGHRNRLEPVKRPFQPSSRRSSRGPADRCWTRARTARQSAIEPRAIARRLS